MGKQREARTAIPCRAYVQSIGLLGRYASRAMADKAIRMRLAQGGGVLTWGWIEDIRSGHITEVRPRHLNPKERP